MRDAPELPADWSRMDMEAKKQWSEGRPILHDHLREYYDECGELTCQLYRYFDSKGTLLYIGITTALSDRDLAHCKRSLWRGAASLMLVETYPSKSVAEVAEAQAIADEQPPENRKWPAAYWDKYDPVPYRWWRKGHISYRGDDPMWAAVAPNWHCWWSPRLIAPPPLTPSHLSLLDRLEAQRAHDAGRRG